MTIQFFIKSITLYYLPSSDYYFEVSSIGQFPALLDGIRRQYILHVYNLCRALCTHRNERLVYGWRKKIGKYNVVMVITSENIWPLMINPIFSQVMTITTSDIFQYFCQPYNNYIHKFVVK